MFSNFSLSSKKLPEPRRLNWTMCSLIWKRFDCLNAKKNMNCFDYMLETSFQNL